MKLKKYFIKHLQKMICGQDHILNTFDNKLQLHGMMEGRALTVYIFNN